MQAKDLRFEDIAIGDSAHFERSITPEDIAAFAALSGDTNPLHVDIAYAKDTQFSRPVVHGMFLAGLFSTLVGMHLPGKRCLYLGQTLQFKKPVYAGDTVEVKGTVLTKSESTHLITLATVLTKNDEEAVVGTATVQVLT